MSEDSMRCVLTLPLLTEPWQEHVLETRFNIIEHLQNSLVAMELRKLKNLQRTRAWRDLDAQIQNPEIKDKKALYRQRTKMLREAGFSKYQFIDDITPMQKHFVEHIYSQVGHRASWDVWRAFESYLFGKGHMVHFKRRGTLESVACSNAGKGMNYVNDTFIWSGGQCKNQIVLSIPVAKPSTPYERDMLTKPQKNYRVVRKWMKTRYKYYLQIMLEGQPTCKSRPIASGRVGLDIGTQSLAIASEKDVRLLELADQVQDNHRAILLLQRRMDASRRSMNPENYNPDGTIRRGVKLTWKRSKHYERYGAKVRHLQRKNADIRKYQHNCLANYILSLGTEIYVEDMNYKGLQRRAKKTEKNANGQFKRKKRFGKSLANKAPAMFLTILDNKLKALDLPGLQKVDTWSFRASQYNHLNQQYKKKKLSQRRQVMPNGDILQRDLYAAFLLMNADNTLQNPDQTLCDITYPAFKIMHDNEMQRLSADGQHHLSSFGLTG